MTDEEKPKTRAKKLVKMCKGEGESCIYADVHPDEVENYKLGDWRVDDSNH